MHCPYHFRLLYLLLAALTLVGCASHAPLRSGTASSYEDLRPVGKRGNTEAIAPRPEHLGRYATALVLPIRVAPSVAGKTSAETIEEIKGWVDEQLRGALRAHFPNPPDNAQGSLQVQLTITRLTEASPWLNVATTALLNPIFNGALAVELEAVDATNGKQRALLIWADEGRSLRPKDFADNFRRTGHAKTLATRFASDAATFLAPLAPPQR